MFTTPFALMVYVLVYAKHRLPKYLLALAGFEPAWRPSAMQSSRTPPIRGSNPAAFWGVSHHAATQAF